MKRISFLLITVILLVSCKKNNDLISNSSNRANPNFDNNSGRGIYKGVSIIPIGTIMIDLMNRDSTASAYLKVGNTIDTFKGIIFKGYPFYSILFYKGSGTTISKFTFFAEKDGSDYYIQSVGLEINNYPYIDFSLLKEKSDDLVYTYSGEFDGDDIGKLSGVANSRFLKTYLKQKYNTDASFSFGTSNITNGSFNSRINSLKANFIGNISNNRNINGTWKDDYGNKGNFNATSL